MDSLLGTGGGAIDHPMVRHLDDDGLPIERLELGSSTAGPIFGDFAVAIEPKSHAAIVADTQNHRLLAFSPDDGELLESKSPVSFRYPNGVAPHPDGYVVVGNTNEHRVDAVNADLTSAGWQVTADRNPPGTYTWPVFVSVDPASKRVWASWHGAELRLGHVVAYGKDGEVLHRLELSPDVEPLALLARRDDVLLSVLDKTGYAVLRFDHAGTRLADFGGALVRDTLREVSAERKRWTAVRDYSRKASIASGLLLIALALWARRQPIRAAVPQPEAEPEASAGEGGGSSRGGIAILLSFLLPGAGHLYQGRTIPGTIFLLGALVLLIPISIFLYVRVFHITDTDIGDVVLLLVLYGVLGMGSAVSSVKPMPG